MASKELQDAISGYENYISANGIDSEVAEAYCEAVEVAYGENDIDYALGVSKRAKEIICGLIEQDTNGKYTIWTYEQYCQDNKIESGILDRWYAILKKECPYRFESFIYYMERKRQFKKRFFYPRRNVLGVVVADMERLENHDFSFYGLSMPARTGKSTICIFFLAWIAFKRPNSHNAMCGHSGKLAKSFYGELLNLITSPDYSFLELYTAYHPEFAKYSFPTKQDAESYKITLGDPERFATISCQGIDGTWTGDIDVSEDGYLYVDDLVRDRMQSLSPVRMESLYQDYNGKVKDRKNDNARELMVGTLWNVLDPLERKRKENADNAEYNFRRIPALDENDHSNFVYDWGGFSDKYYHEMRDSLLDADWMAKYQQQPYAREGLMFPSEELQYFNGVLPEGDYRRIGVVDVAWGGGDSLSMPIGAEYENGDIYIFDWVFNRGTKEVTMPLVVTKIISNEIRQMRFEGNQGGDLYCADIDKELRDRNYKCSCTSKKAPNQLDKRSKIIAYSGTIKRKFYFLSPHRATKEQLDSDAELGITRYTRTNEYQAAMDELTSFVSVGKNEHDDAADALTQLQMFVEKPVEVHRTIIMESPI